MTALIVRFPVTIQASGVIRPVSEKTFVKTLLAGQVTNVYKKEGDKVKPGDTIISMSSEKLNIKETSLKEILLQKNIYIKDLSNMCSSDDFINPVSDLYKKELANHTRKMEELRNKLQKAEKEYERNKILFKSDIISEKEFDDIKYLYTLAQSELNLYKSAKLAEWQNALTSYETEVEQDKSEIKSIMEEKEFCNVKAPVSGTIDELQSVFTGTNIDAGQIVAVISPDTGLVSEVFVTSKDIGLIRNGNDVKIQVDAFNYNEWGMISGKVAEISDDYILVNNTPCFRIRCKMNKNQLSLRNGIKGRLKKGMTIRARFKVTEKTIMQLIFENIDNWFNPTQKNT
jgi:multidrug resistance efflux pump